MENDISRRQCAIKWILAADPQRGRRAEKGVQCMDERKKLTNEVGAPVPDNENAITAGPGPGGNAGRVADGKDGPL